MKIPLLFRSAPAVTIALIGLLSAEMLFSPNVAWGDTVLSDDLVTQGHNGWADLVGTPGIRSYVDKDALWIGNSVSTKPLGKTLTQNFEVSLKVAMSKYSTTQWVGLFDADAAKGYAIYWDSGSSDTNNGQGIVGIVKILLPTTGSSWNDYVQYAELGPNKNVVLSSEPISQYTDARPVPADPVTGPRIQTELKLTWDASTHTLTAFVDGKQITTSIDNSFNSFSTAVIFGTVEGMVNDLLVTSTQTDSAPNAPPTP